MSSSATPGRLAYLDWMRGLAAVVMLQGHVFHSFSRADQRDQAPYVLSQFVGGLPPAFFLFLTGVTLAFLMHSAQRRGLGAGQRVLVALRRAGYLLLVAFAVRFQLWLFCWPHSPWTDLLKVDVLNAMALAVAAFAALAVFQTEERVGFAAAVGVVIAAASPLVSNADWGQVPALVKHYLAPDFNFFSFFPWGAYLAFGVSAGSLLRLLNEEQTERAMQWLGLLGLALIVGGRYFADIPYSLYPVSDFWLNSPWLVFIKTGVVCATLPAAYLWNRYAIGENWSWVRQLGTNSLLVYWVHIELVYGRWFGGWKESLTALQCAASAAGLIVGMLLLSVLRSAGPLAVLQMILDPFAVRRPDPVND